MRKKPNAERARREAKGDAMRRYQARVARESKRAAKLIAKRPPGSLVAIVVKDV